MKQNIIDFPEDILGAHSKLIMDPVHGGIPLYEHEVLVIDHPLFQRLRTICQNDILSLVFPGATHSRFLHSIGVMHIASRMFRNMVDSYLNEVSKHKRSTVQLKHLRAIDYFTKLIRLAGLLHDCGHSSFSHQFTKAQRIKALLHQTGRFEDLWKGIQWQNFYDDIPARLEHEHYSIRCAHEILTGVDIEQYGIVISDVLALMETTTIVPSEQFKEAARFFWLFITGLSPNDPQLVDADLARMVQSMLSHIISGEFDADRADYMLRDGFHSSVTIGGYNLDHLLSNLRFGWDLETPWLGLAITRKGIGALEDFVYSRHQMYKQVYGHKTALGFDWLLREAINEVLTSQDHLDFVEDCISDMHGFTDLTDSFFWEAFRQFARLKTESFSYLIVHRKKLKHLVTIEDLPANQIEAQKYLLAKQLQIDPGAIVECTMHARFSNIKASFNKMKVLVKDSLTGKHSLKRIDEVSNFFSKFSDQTITHFYRLPEELSNA